MIYPANTCGVTAHRSSFGLVGRSNIMSLAESLVSHRCTQINATELNNTMITSLAECLVSQRCIQTNATELNNPMICHLRAVLFLLKGC